MIELMLIFAATVAQPADVPEYVACIKTSISATGRTSRNRVIVSSGDRSHDRGALQFLRALDFSRLQMGVELDQTGHILVRATGAATYTVDVTEARLLDSCPNGKSAGA